MAHVAERIGRVTAIETDEAVADRAGAALSGPEMSAVELFSRLTVNG
jgi:protein-L-isoaspartate O-methyltransferase